MIHVFGTYISLIAIRIQPIFYQSKSFFEYNYWVEIIRLKWLKYNLIKMNSKNSLYQKVFQIASYIHALPKYKLVTNMYNQYTLEGV